MALFIFLFSFSFVAAENVTKVGEAYTCLGDKITDQGCDTLIPEERFFSLLSLNRCEAEVLADSVNDECWPASGCNIKSTAQAILSLNRADQDTNDAETWLLEQKAIPSDMIWYLQVDSNEAVSCEVRYDDTSYPFSIAEDKKITAGSLGYCLSVSDNDYWLEISSTSQLGCYEKEFETSCDVSFLTSLLFTKSGSATIHVLEGVQTAPADGATLEKINSFCFSTGSRCDYEGSLWSAYVLDKLGNDVSAFLPYLVSLEEDNEQYLPEAFLYMLTGNIDYSTRLLAKQLAHSYWRESGDEFYDTALALYPFKSSSPQEKEDSKEWLLSENVQDENGCWENNLRNTAFLLTSIWPEHAPLGDDWYDDDDDGVDDENETTLDCNDEGYYCRSSANCYGDQGSILDDYNCAYPNVCCSVPPSQELCEDLGGTVCDYNQDCTGNEEETQDLLYGETCCVGGICEDSGSGNGDDNENDCEDYGGACRSFGCLDDEESTSLYSCSSGDTCCVDKISGGKGGRSSAVIWVLLILIIIAVIAIIFRDKLRRMLFGAKSRMGKGDAKPNYGGPRRPGPPEYPAPLTGHPRRMPTPTGRVTPRPGGPKLRSQKELDEVLVKLKDMGR